MLIGGYALIPDKEIQANPGVFNVLPPLTIGTTTPASASSTLATYSIIRAGAATSTSQILNSYAAGTYGSLDSAVLFIQATATGTAPIVKWRYEYSQDAIDWYSESIETTTNATTTVVSQTAKEYQWAWASTTAGTANGTSTNFKMVNVPTPTRYVRAVFYLPAGSANVAIFNQWVSKNQK